MGLGLCRVSPVAIRKADRGIEPSASGAEANRKQAGL